MKKYNQLHLPDILITLFSFFPQECAHNSHCTEANQICNFNSGTCECDIGFGSVGGQCVGG